MLFSKKWLHKARISALTTYIQQCTSIEWRLTLASAIKQEKTKAHKLERNKSLYVHNVIVYKKFKGSIKKLVSEFSKM